MSRFELPKIERTYQAWARIYEWLTPVYLLGNERRLRVTTCAALELKPGDAVLDVACGTGRNFTYILDQIGPHGKLVGVDFTEAMLDVARERVKRQGWKNVELIQADAASMELAVAFDAALCTLAIGVIPEYRRAQEHMVAHLKPGGRLAIGGAKRSTLWYGRPFNWLAELLGSGAAQDMSKRPWEAFRELVDGYTYQEWFSGFFYVTAGRAPKT